ncbi:MAG: DUF423 domain-containing protein [Planctomycetes bacterium]|nr:DUF423 domain-containing protein [Planctomycetota bacterium]
MDARGWIVCGALLGAIGVTTGAYSAHGLEQRLIARGLDAKAVTDAKEQFDTAVRYQMYHALAMVAIGIMAGRRAGRPLHTAGFCFLFGVLLFSGNLYAQVLLERSIHQLIPVGGGAFILGWCALAVAGFRLPNPKSEI